ncbi:unnamed protein product [Cyprideis torosa]|uniref:Uncharacterized protein n=1 Tax=Cyprideis torosa TaxID=163714 RepID=A0A7R8ZIP2_9CRUS|nr:unnamed protein product [Cyprideis torosa]CAG0886626.1 unnamed protein product [Cyprideis torosa]
MVQLLVLLALIGMSCADHGYYGAPSHHAPTYVEHVEKDSPAYYKFEYAVKDYKTGNDFGHAEDRHGYDTKGQYHVSLPDGRKQTVTYQAGKEGYNADVKYDGEPVYPVEHVPYKTEPSYLHAAYKPAPYPYKHY